MDEQVITQAGQGSHVAGAALAVWVLVSVLKSDRVPINVPPAVRPWLALVLGQVYAVLSAVVLGQPWGAAVVDGLLATTLAVTGQELGSSVTRLPPPPPSVLPLLLTVAALGGLTSCGGAQQVTRLAEAARDVAVVAEPCLVEVQRAELRTCEGEAGCEGMVRQRWAPVAAALDVLHDAWCGLSPESEGCR
jgi:hypothetical protein